MTQYEAARCEYRKACQAHREARDKAHSLRLALNMLEARPWLMVNAEGDPQINGKNAEIRDAQLVKILNHDPEVSETRTNLENAKRAQEAAETDERIARYDLMIERERLIAELKQGELA